jgi:sec-independent protein translocase protein TatA
MPSFTHLLLLGLILMLVFGKTKLPDLGRTLGESARNFKKAMRGEEDIDVTHTVKRIEDDNEST